MGKQLTWQAAKAIQLFWFLFTNLFFFVLFCSCENFSKTSQFLNDFVWCEFADWKTLKWLLQVHVLGINRRGFVSPLILLD